MLSLVFGLGFSARADALDTWFVRTSGTTAALTAATYGDGSFVAVGLGGVLLASTNGSDWVSRNTGRPLDIFGVCYGNGVFVAAGGPYGLTNVFVSTNTIEWPRLLPGIWYGVGFWGASYAGGFYFLAGDNMSILTASNIDFSCAGKLTNCNWTLRNYGGNRSLAGVAYGNNVYVAVGDSVLLASGDAITWASNSVNSHMYDVAFGNGTFVAVGIGAILSSPDGVSWTNRFFGGGYLYRIVFGNGTFVAAGYGKIVTSTDGVSWRTRTLPPGADVLTGVTYGNGTFVATGEGGTILQSASVSVPSLTATRDSPSGGIVLALAGEIGRGYRIQVSTNLATSGWEDFRVFTNTAPTMEFLDTEAINLPQRFYRAVSP